MRIGRTVLLLVALLFPAVDAWANDPAGTILRLRCDVIIVGGDGTVRAAATDAVLFVGDRVLTGIATRFELELLDGTVVTLGDDSDLAIDAMLFDPQASAGRLELALARGVFRFVSGALAQTRDAVAVRTPLGTIGIRGTDFWGEQSDERLRVVLLDGAIYVDTPLGRVEVFDPRRGVLVDGPQAAPAPLPPISDDELQRAVETIAF